MSTRTRIAPIQLPSIDMSAASTASTSTILASNSTITYSGSWSGSSPVGTLALQFSDDYSLNPNGSVDNIGTWETAPIAISGALVTSGSISGNTGTFRFDATTAAYASRLLYTKVSGTGTLTIYVSGRTQ